MMRTKLTSAAVFGLSIALAYAAKKLPRFPENTSYDEARESLIALGWKPVKQSPTFCEGDRCGLVRCSPGFAHRCEAYPEALICRGTGCTTCEFLWRRGETLIEVITYGESDPPIVGTKCSEEVYGGGEWLRDYSGGVRCRTNCP
jgi:hypothetical protein